MQPLFFYLLEYETLAQFSDNLVVLVVHVHEDHIFKLCVLVVSVAEEPSKYTHFASYDNSIIARQIWQG